MWNSREEQEEESGWTVVEKNKRLARPFAVTSRTETFCWTQKLSKEDYGTNKYLYFEVAVINA